MTIVRNGDRLPATLSRDVLCVDLDGTLIVGDLLWESFVTLVRRKPLAALAAVCSLWRGKAHFKRRVAEAIGLECGDLAYQQDLVAHLRELRKRGTYLVLATASDDAYARAVAAHVGVFDEVLASDGVRNLSGRFKAAALVERFGERGFRYAGNDWHDVPVWRAAAEGIAVAPAPALEAYGTSTGLFQKQYGARRGRARAIVKALRPHQWLKNILIFVPFIAAHDILRLDLWAVATLAFTAFSLCASAIYIINDIIDVQSDRLHPRKRERPFAKGELDIPTGAGMSAGLLLAGCTLAGAGVSWEFLGIVGVYLAATTLYSIRLKREPVLDVFFLTGLYVLRIIAGGIATQTPLTAWLLAFALFLFLSLAFVKRYVELVAMEGTTPGRGYCAADAQWMHAIGTSAGYMAVLVLALYVTAPDVGVLYSRAYLLWLLCPLLLYWITRLWFRAGRRMLHDDPVMEAATDATSYVVAALAAAVMIAAAV